MTTEHRHIIGADIRGTDVIGRWNRGAESVWPAFWLRDNCRCPRCRHPGNGQKLYEITDLPTDLSAREAKWDGDETLRVLWSDGHRSDYAGGWLSAHDLAPEARQARRVKPSLWGAEIGNAMPAGSWPALLADPNQELAWLELYTAHGFGLLKDVPTKSGMVAEVGDRLGFVRVTNYGRLFDVMSVPNPNNMAFTPVGLGVHSDNPYRHPSPGVQLLHCLESGAPGGDTLLVDGFAAAETLRSEDPEAFDLLTAVPMHYRFADAHAELTARQRLISIDMDGVVVAVHFNNRSADWLDAPAEIAGRWYAAYRKFAEILKRPERELIFRLAPGDCVVMQNDRALHGRTAFDPSLGRRHLQGCYIDRDGIESRRLVLRRGTPREKVHAA
jgi:gamma-butyrobetaine dioxygenase